MTDTKVKKAKAPHSSELPWPVKAGSVASESNKSPIVVQKAFDRSDLIRTLSEQVGIDKKQATAVLDTLKDVIVAHLALEGPQHFKWPGLFSMKIKEKAATKERQGVNPFTKEPTTFAAKPAQRLVKITPMNSLKDLIETKA